MSHASALTASMLLAAVACMGQTRTPKDHAAPAPAKAPVKQALKPDSAIEAEIRAKFAKSKINVEKFQVHVQGGVATIEGKTNVIQHKGVATRLAKTGGAIAVNNHIEISEAARQKAADNLEKGRRRVQVKRGEPRSDGGTAR